MWSKNRPIILGHRGFMSKYPENSILAFLEAIKAGADGIELDVWLTQDGEVVVYHDEYIAAIGKRIKNASLKEIKSINIGMDQGIPTLREIFESMPKNSLINVEIKDVDAVEKTLKLIDEFKIEERIMISSFLIESLRKVRERNKEIKIGLLVNDEDIIPEIPELAKELSLYSVNLPIDALKFFPMDMFVNTLKQIRNWGLKVALWADDDSLYYRDDNILHLKDIVDIVITNDVQRMRNYLL